MQNSFIQDMVSSVNHLLKASDNKAGILDMLISGKKSLSEVLKEAYVLIKTLSTFFKIGKTCSVIESAKTNTQSGFVNNEMIGLIK